MAKMELDQVEGPSDPDGMDEVQYSRLIYTLGKDAVKLLQRKKVLIFGCKGLGAEIAKNLVLSGVERVGLVDSGNVTMMDLGACFLFREEDVGHNRTVCAAKHLKELGSTCIIEAISSFSPEIHVKNYDMLVATCGTMPFLVNLNQICRENSLPMIVARTRGVFGFVFADFGDQFIVNDEHVEPSSDMVIESVTQDFPATVTIVEEQRHGLEEGDEIVFHEVKGMEELNDLGPVTVDSTATHSFTILVDTRCFGCYKTGGYISKVKSSKVLKFLSLEASLAAPKFCGHDLAKECHIPALHAAFQAIDAVERLNDPDSSMLDPVVLIEDDLKNVLSLSKELRSKHLPSVMSSKMNDSVRQKLQTKTIHTEIKVDQILTNVDVVEGDNDEDIVKLLASGAHVELAPLVSVIGGITAQEAIKALTGLFMPLHQWLYYDAVECLPSSIPSFHERSNVSSRYAAQVALFGRDLQEKLGYGQWLVVGAGGVGCEVMKNLVLMGVGCTPNGSIIITDMDNLSKANLTSQALYHVDDLGRPKAPTASRALRRINISAQVHAHNVMFCSESETLFDSSFFDAISGVFSAVDTSSSRLYLDARCVAYRKPMIDGGRHGTRGSVQVFIPHHSEMYASSRDPPEHKEIPICTLKNFPYAMEHTLRWAVELFDTLFKQRPDDVNSYLSNRDFLEVLKKSPAAEPLLETLRDALVKYKPLSFEACVEWARLQFEELFSNSIKQICHNFPADMKTSAGALFWSGTKRLPEALKFDPEDSLHLEFIIAAANLQATVYGLKGCHDQRQFKQILKVIQVPEFQPKDNVKIPVTDADLQSTSQRNPGAAGLNSGCSSSSILCELPAPATLAGYRLSPIEFDKDDTENFHVEFVHSAANLRAQNYGIRYSDKLQVRLVGGKVVPSIVTSNAVVGGLMCLEIYKLLQKKPLKEFKHSYFNLSLPLFTSAHPIKAVENKVIRSNKEALTWTLWDKFEMDCTGMTLETFLREFNQQHGLEVNMIMYGKSLLYAEFLNKKKLQERMSLTILELIQNVGKLVIPTTENKLILSLTCVDANDDDVEVPDIIVKVR